ncbi:response regulator transcription factor [Pedobacter sp. ISL-68]|uniref:LytR/AlgR family response regulator transcription factor n=1 Tax=unclassified Pedobacter TaxID=2628915 RepID=UPI001BEA2166|nr:MULTISPECIES: LytTR family DNA-binding domain-containing protein [unclassified Pedobacter]MBT2563750.1 response regulator transcription factor [Pedobacter sp. ISL-64]MBT2589642.1 response regulator transcription factor [Pedobacter sp. ISL-68]
MELECIVIDDETYAITQIEDMIAITPGIVHRQSFENAFDAIQYLHNHQRVHIVFCDIRMPFIDGIEAGKLLNEYCDFLVYVTAHREYGREASELNAAGYLVKPIRRAAFMEKVKMLISRMPVLRPPFVDNPFLYIKGSLKNTYFSVSFEEIILIRAEANYVSIKTTGGARLSYNSLSQIEKNIENRTEFMKINRSVIISMFFFDHVDGYEVYLKDKSSFTLGREYRPVFFEFLKKRMFNR